MATIKEKTIEKLFEAGAHYGYSRSRRHPSAAPFIYGIKNTVEIFDLEKTEEALKNTVEFVKSLSKDKKQILFVSGKKEVGRIISEGAERINMPYVAGRWIGGTLTNFEEIRKRVDRLTKLVSEREKGEHEKFTKHERLLIDREIRELDERFGGIVSMEKLPKAVFVIDSKEESIAVSEAKLLGIPVIAVLNSDCNFNEVDHPLPANDSNVRSISLFVDYIVSAYKEGKE